MNIEYLKDERLPKGVGRFCVTKVQISEAVAKSTPAAVNANRIRDLHAVIMNALPNWLFRGRGVSLCYTDRGKKNVPINGFAHRKRKRVFGSRP